MEDYSIDEIKNIKDKVAMLVEHDEKLVKKISSFCEVLPLRFSCDLTGYSNEYINITKNLFTFYYNKEDTYYNELLRLKKHFKHYQRYPFILYISRNNEKYDLVVKICNDLKIECVCNEKLFISKIKNDKKIFLIDSDGTLRCDDGSVSKENMDAIKRVTSNGDYVVLCTSRPRYHTLDLMSKINSSKYIISSNGAETYDAYKNKIVKAYYVSKKSINYLIEKCYKLDIRLVLTTDNEDFVTKEVRNESQTLLDKSNYKKQLENIKIKTCMVIDSNINSVNKLKEEIMKKKDICIVNEKSKNDSYYEDWFCVGSSKTLKSNGVINLATYLNIPLKNTISIGNDYNDLPMFEVSGISFAVDNATNDIKKNVDFVVPSNNNSGVAYAINKTYSETQSKL